MTTKRNNKSNSKNDVKSSSLPPPSLYNIQYPNSRTGMFSLRVPYKYFNTDQSQQQEPIYTRTLTPDIVHPEYLHVDQIQQEQPYFTESSKRDAEVQCSLIDPYSRNGLAIRRHQIFKTNPYNYGYLSPRYRVQLKLQPIQPNIYEVWNVKTPPPRSIPLNEPIKPREKSIRIHSPRTVNIKSLSDDESDDDDYLVYARYSPRTYYPPNVRMVCVRQDANTIYF